MAFVAANHFNLVPAKGKCMKPLVVISTENAASQNIKEALLGLLEFEGREEGFWRADCLDMAQYDGSIIEIVPKHDADYYIFASTHKSASNTPALTCHTPGNWGEAALGGEERRLNVAFGSKVKVAAQEMKKLCAEELGWKVDLEADHHGPTLEKPVLFVEIGSTQAEWGNPVAGKIAAQAIIAAAKSHEEFPAYVGFGGTHYAPKFSPLVFGGESAVGHIISGYALERDGMDRGRVGQALEKNVEKLEGALIDWKGIKQEPKRKLVGMLEELGVEWKKA
jgi:D-tyrosyl-tRNA(Tyr) deacylase